VAFTLQKTRQFRPEPPGGKICQSPHATERFEVGPAATMQRTGPR